MQQKGYWRQGDVPEFSTLRGRYKADVAVVGGGLTGVTTALWLSRAGLRVMLVEAERLGRAATALCGGCVTLLPRLQYADIEKRFGSEALRTYVRTMQGAFGSLRDLAVGFGDDVDWSETDALCMAQDEREAQRLQPEAQTMERVGLCVQTLPSAQGVMPCTGALLLGGMATLQPRAYFARLVQQLADRDVRIFERSRATALETNLVYTERGSIEAPYVVVATGYPIVNVPGWYFLRLSQRRRVLIPLAGQPQVDRLYATAAGDRLLRGIQGGALLQMDAGGVGERVALDEAWLKRTCGQYRHTAHSRDRYMGQAVFSDDGLPYAGVYSRKTPNLFVGTGYGAQGLLGSVLTAQAVSARVLGLADADYGLYTSQRSHWPFGRQTLRQMGRYAAGYLFRPSAPRCPHMGCKLRYDTQRRVWECPCHGSRFDDIGHVQNAPAVWAADPHRAKRS